MFVFLGKVIKVVIPSNRIIRVTQSGKNIDVAYDSGEVTYLSNVGESVVPKIEKISCNYETEEIATDVMRSFYVACESNKGAFYF